MSAKPYTEEDLRRIHHMTEAEKLAIRLRYHREIPGGTVGDWRAEAAELVAKARAEYQKATERAVFLQLLSSLSLVEGVHHNTDDTHQYIAPGIDVDDPKGPKKYCVLCKEIHR